MFEVLESKEIEIIDVHDVRLIAPRKRMYCIEMIIPLSVLQNNAEKRQLNTSIEDQPKKKQRQT